VRAVLPTVRVPTLVLHHADDPFVTPTQGKYVADHISDAKYVELPGRNVFHFVEPWRDSFQEIAEFLTGQQAEVAEDRVLATVLFTDIVDSTRRAAEIGDRDWHALLDAHDAIVRAQLTRFRGREVNTAGDGFLAMFDGPQRAIRCAMAIRDAVQTLGIQVRSRACPASGTSSPSPLRSGGFRRTAADRLRSARTLERAAAAVPV